jgi:hypothetical protein
VRSSLSIVKTPRTRRRPRVLLACTPAGYPLLSRILSEKADLVTAFSVAQAVQKLDDGVDLVLCSVQFNESRMLELAREVAGRKNRPPFVCCRVLESERSPRSLQAVMIGSVAFIDLLELERKAGARAFEQFFGILLSRLPPASAH